MKKLIFVIGFFAMLSGCSSCVIKERCEKTNWFQYGHDLAMKGQRPAQDSFVNECRKLEAEMSESQLDSGFKSGRDQYCKPEIVYNTGKSGQFFNSDFCDGGELKILQEQHRKGVRDFCQPESAHHFGLSGKEYNKICPADLEKSFLVSYNKGRKKFLLSEQDANRAALYKTETEISSLERDRSSLAMQLALIPQPRIIVERQVDPATGFKSEKERTEDPYQSRRDSLNSDISHKESEIRNKRSEKDRIVKNQEWIRQELLKVESDSQ